MPVDVKAEVAGKVWKIEKQVGERVEAGETLLIIESMKMEIPVPAPGNGALLELRVEEGDSVEEGALLARIG